MAITDEKLGKADAELKEMETRGWRNEDDVGGIG